MKVLVCGGRDFDNWITVFGVLDALLIKYGMAVSICHGGAPGADSLAGEWAKSRRVPVKVYKAKWSVYGKGAGPIRNKEMYDDFQPDLTYAMPGGTGTDNMIAYSLVQGTPVVKYDKRGNFEILNPPTRGEKLIDF